MKLRFKNYGYRSLWEQVPDQYTFVAPSVTAMLLETMQAYYGPNGRFQLETRANIKRLLNEN